MPMCTVNKFDSKLQIHTEDGFKGEQFKGFLVQARNAANDEAVGKFIVESNDEEPRAQHLTCSEDAKEVN